MIKPCTCHHRFQDVTYGKGMRVMNRCRYPSDTTRFTGARCTVCGKVYKMTEAEIRDESGRTDGTTETD